jgi:hypothetical protein
MLRCASAVAVLAKIEIKAQHRKLLVETLWSRMVMIFPHYGVFSKKMLVGAVLDANRAGTDGRHQSC